MFWTTLLSVLVQLTDDRKQKLLFGGKVFFLGVCSLHKNVDCFGTIHQWEYTEVISKTEAAI